MSSEWLNEAREYKGAFDGVGGEAYGTYWKYWVGKTGGGYSGWVPSGEEGWALSGQDNSIWIECGKTGLNYLSASLVRSAARLRPRVDFKRSRALGSLKPDTKTPHLVQSRTPQWLGTLSQGTDKASFFVISDRKATL